MIGYITVYQPDMKFRDYYRYREYYCGLCRTLGRRRGQTARITLGYDMTFLAVLLDGVYDSATESKEFRCPAHPLGKRKALNNVFVDYAADMNLYMAWLKCLDDWCDDRNLLRGAYARFLSRRIRRIEEEYRDKTEVINAALEDLNRLEQEGFSVTLLDVHEDGLVRVEELEQAIRENLGYLDLTTEQNTLLANQQAQLDEQKAALEEAQAKLEHAAVTIEKQRAELRADIQHEIVDVALTASTMLMGKEELEEQDQRALESFVKEIQDESGR